MDQFTGIPHFDIFCDFRVRHFEINLTTSPNRAETPIHKGFQVGEVLRKTSLKPHPNLTQTSWEISL